MPEEMNRDYFSRWIAREKAFIKAALETDAFPKRKMYMEDLSQKLSEINTDTAFVVIVKTPLYVVWQRKYSEEGDVYKEVKYCKRGVDGPAPEGENETVELRTWFANPDNGFDKSLVSAAHTLDDSISSNHESVLEGLKFNVSDDGDLIEPVSGLMIRELSCSPDVLKYIAGTKTLTYGYKGAYVFTKAEYSWLIEHTVKIGDKVRDLLP